MKVGIIWFIADRPLNLKHSESDLSPSLIQGYRGNTDNVKIQIVMGIDDYRNPVVCGLLQLGSCWQMQHLAYTYIPFLNMKQA